MDRAPVKSSNVVSIGYDPARQALEVEFRSGTVYRYDGVPPDIHQALMQSRSAGTFVAREIRARYAATRL